MRTTKCGAVFVVEAPDKCVVVDYRPMGTCGERGCMGSEGNGDACFVTVELFRVFFCEVKRMRRSCEGDLFGTFSTAFSFT